jgi:hypothetical protein
MQGLKFNRRIFGCHDQKQRTFLVAQEQVLGVAAGDLAAQRARLLDGEDGGMLHRLVGNAETVQISEKFVRRASRRHGLTYKHRRICESRFALFFLASPRVVFTSEFSNGLNA